MVILQFCLRNYKHTHTRFSRARFISVESSPPRNSAKANGNQSLLGYMCPYNYASVLGSCTNVKDLIQAHADIVMRGLEHNVFLQTKLSRLYACFGYLGDARQLFDKMSEPNVHAWNAMIRGYATNGFPEETLGFYYRSKQAGIQPDSMTFPFALKACAGIFALEECKEIHCHVFKSGFESDVFVATALTNAYVKCGVLEDARQVFDKMLQRNVVSWTAMIGGYACNGDVHEALRLFHQMQEDDVKPNPITVASVLPAYAELKDLEQGKRIHDYVVKSDFESNVLVGTELIKMYLKIGSVENARHVFDRISHGNEDSWSAMITGYVQNGYPNEALELFYQMQLEGMTPEPVSLTSFLSACSQLGTLQQGKWLHVYIIKCGFEENVFVGTALIDMYAKCGSVDIAQHCLDKMSEWNVVSWNALIAGYSQNGHNSLAIVQFSQMQLLGIRPDAITMVSLLSACGHLRNLQQSLCVHNYIIKTGLESDVSVGNSLVAMYAKCGDLEIAGQLFQKMSRRDVVSWNAIIGGYEQNGHTSEALLLFHRMQIENTKPDPFTIVSVLSACGHLQDLQQGKQIHNFIIRNGFESDVFVGTALLDMYFNCGSMQTAHHLFNKISAANVVAWNAMIAGYAHHGPFNEALMLFHQMQVADIRPDSITLMSVISACGQLGALQQGMCIHDYSIRRRFKSDVSVGNSLIAMYAKCGRVEIARKLFDMMTERNLVSWSSMIGGYGMHGRGKDAIKLFGQMEQAGIKPNHITFLGVLSACSHAGMVDDGRWHFDYMSREYCISPRVDHYTCMVDLLGRAGRLEEAHKLIQQMPLEPDAGVWGALLGACRIHCNVEMGEHVAKHIFDLEPENPGYYVLLSNIYAAAGRWDQVAKVRLLVKDRGLKKPPGCTFIEVNRKLQSFTGGDRSHPQSEKIYATMEVLVGQMKEAGYIPDKSFVLHDVEDEDKIDMLSSHSEKLAIAFGLVNTSDGTPIKLIKNLRVCGDCHIATKHISKILMRDVIVRDATRFHHFRDGFCSCGDYW